MNEWQKAFVEVIENKASLNSFGLPYNKFISLFKDSSFSLENLYEMFCLGYEAGKESTRQKKS